MRTLMIGVGITLTLFITGVWGQTPKGDYPSIELFVMSADMSDTAPDGIHLQLPPESITCGLDSASKNGSGAYFGSWVDPLDSTKFCQVDITSYVTPLPSGMWYVGVTFMEDVPSTYFPCPEYEVNGGCSLKKLDGTPYPNYYIDNIDGAPFPLGITGPGMVTNIIVKE